jgi:hypothetical protein
MSFLEKTPHKAFKHELPICAACGLRYIASLRTLSLAEIHTAENAASAVHIGFPDCWDLTFNYETDVWMHSAPSQKKALS